MGELVVFMACQARETITGLAARQVFERCDPAQVEAAMAKPDRIAALADVVSRAEETF